MNLTLQIKIKNVKKSIEVQVSDCHEKLQRTNDDPAELILHKPKINKYSILKQI
jgi:hypothetical protein